MKRKTANIFSSTIRAYIIFSLLVWAMIPCISWAAFEADTKKAEPSFIREGNMFRAKLVPKAKNSSVLIDFEVLHGGLVNVEGMDFESTCCMGVDKKDFKSGLFTMEVTDVSPGGEILVSISSDFFSGSTELWIFNQKLKEPWMNSEAKSSGLSSLVQLLEVKVKDGGSFDSDGTPDGRIFLVCGPRDSFWGYTIGTLFIRYFGIFIVLTLLMLGLLFSGKLFRSLESKKDNTTGETLHQTKEEKEGDKGLHEGVRLQTETPISAESVAAIAVALDLYFTSLQSSVPMNLSAPQFNAWIQHGREQIMEARFLVYNRYNQ